MSIFIVMTKLMIDSFQMPSKHRQTRLGQGQTGRVEVREPVLEDQEVVVVEEGGNQPNEEVRKAQRPSKKSKKVTKKVASPKKKAGKKATIPAKTVASPAEQNNSDEEEDGDLDLKDCESNMNKIKDRNLCIIFS